MHIHSQHDDESPNSDGAAAAAAGDAIAAATTNRGDHTEVISIDFDPTVVTYNQLLALFWNNHEYGLTTRIKRQVRKGVCVYALADLVG